MMLDIACGNYKHEGCVGYDVDSNSDADIIDDVDNILLHFPKKSIEKVFMYECLEHFLNPVKVLSDLYILLAEHGELEISIPNKYYYRCIGRWILYGEQTCSLYHISSWEKPEIINLLNMTGFIVYDIWYRTPKQYYGKDFFSDLLCKIGMQRIGEHSIVINAIKK